MPGPEDYNQQLRDLKAKFSKGDHTIPQGPSLDEARDQAHQAWRKELDTCTDLAGADTEILMTLRAGFTTHIGETDMKIPLAKDETIFDAAEHILAQTRTDTPLPPESLAFGRRGTKRHATGHIILS